MTNGDRVRQFTDEELARFLCNRTQRCEYCNALKLCTERGKGYENGIAKWLEQEATNDK